MNEIGKPRPIIDVILYDHNRSRIPQERLVPYAGKWVAISGDGTQVIASAPRIEELAVNLDVLGISSDSVGWERIPALDEDTWL